VTEKGKPVAPDACTARQNAFILPARGISGEQNVSSSKYQRAAIDMRTFAKNAGATVRVPAGNVVFGKGDPGDCMYIVQAGVIDMVIGDKVIETIGEGEALGFMSMIDGEARSSTAKAREACELSLIDARTFRFMVDEVPNFASYIMSALAQRIRGMGKAI
jgi:CRP-like cAMP-binding protein